MWHSARRQWGVVLLAAVSACERPGPGAAKDTTVPALPPPDSAVTPTVSAQSPWDSAAGPVFLVSGPNAQQAAIIVPGIDTTVSLDTVRFELTPYRTATFDLFRGGQRTGSGRLGSVISLDIPDECTAWPLMQLGDAPDSVAGGWTVGFAAGHFQPLAADSLSGLPRADSSRLARDVARMASAVPGDTVEALRGLPFVVTRGWRVLLGGGVTAVIAEVTRALNQEASPAYEHLFLVIERDSASTSVWRQAYAERAAGGEESLESNELLAVGSLQGRDQPVMLLARFVGDGVIYSLLERTAAGKWRLRWSSPYAGC